MESQLPQRQPATHSLVFKVRRREPELVCPAKPTLRVLKPLSDIDDQDGLRFHIPVIQFYRHNPSKRTDFDPVRVIRRALAETLVYFYPFAGRLREGPNRKLMVDCTGEGVIFIEADADVALDDFGDALQPPFPCIEELLFDVPGSRGVIDSPLMLIQVTRLNCGSFIFALRLNHTMSDAAGLFLFMKTLAEFARGANATTVPAAWDRHLLSARITARVTHAHHEYDQVLANADDVPHDHMIHRSFFFGPKEISKISKLLPTDLRVCSTTFEILTAFLWRHRTISLFPRSDTKMRIICIVDARSKLRNPPLPRGYYGNAFAFPVAIATAKDLSEQPLEFALKLVQKAKSSVTEEYMRSIADLMTTRGRPHFAVAGTFLVSDVTHVGFRDIDYGWGKALYGGPAKGGVGAIPGVASFYIPFKNKSGENGILVPICLPEPAMERFMEDLNNVMAKKPTSDGGSNEPFFISSSL